MKPEKLAAAREPGSLVEQVIIRRSRLVDKDVAAQYLGTSTDTVERLIQSGALPIVKLPVANPRKGHEDSGVSRRVLLDVRDLDALIDRSKESKGPAR